MEDLKWQQSRDWQYVMSRLLFSNWVVLRRAFWFNVIVNRWEYDRHSRDRHPRVVQRFQAWFCAYTIINTFACVNYFSNGTIQRNTPFVNRTWMSFQFNNSPLESRSGRYKSPQPQVKASCKLISAVGELDQQFNLSHLLSRRVMATRVHSHQIILKWIVVRVVAASTCGRLKGCGHGCISE